MDLLEPISQRNTILSLCLLIINHWYSTLKEIRNSIQVNFSAHLWTTLYFKDLISRKSRFSISGFIYTSSVLGLGALPAFQAYPFCKSLMNVLGNFVARDFKTRYYTTVCTIGQVMTNMNNPLKEQGVRPEDVDSKDLPNGFITAKECAKWMLVNFSKYQRLNIHQF